MVSGIDHAIGRFMQALAEAGLAENTIVVYSADNGYHMGNRGLAGKWSHFEESLRVPLIIADPRVDAASQGKTTDAMALNVDLPATFLDWGEHRFPTAIRGKPATNCEQCPRDARRLAKGDVSRAFCGPESHSGV
ncbi:MAG: sulfatase-like hydrolase/transferase [Pirellulaceae bacterium]